jgi:hypothetical protein
MKSKNANLSDSSATCLRTHAEGGQVSDERFRRRDADGGGRDERAPGKVAKGRGNLVRAAVLALLFASIAPAARAQDVSTKGAPAVRGTAIDAIVPTPAAPAAKTEAIQTTMVGGQAYLHVDFQLLASYPFDTPNEKVTNDTAIAQVEKQIPAQIKALDGKKVMIRGFMVPVKEVQGRSTEFLIVRDQPTCCYSGMTTITEFVSVKVPGQGVESIMDQPVTVQGKLHVGAVIESGYVLGLYRVDGEKLFESPKP